METMGIGSQGRDSGNSARQESFKVRFTIIQEPPGEAYSSGAARNNMFVLIAEESSDLSDQHMELASHQIQIGSRLMRSQQVFQQYREVSRLLCSKRKHCVAPFACIFKPGLVFQSFIEPGFGEGAAKSLLPGSLRVPGRQRPWRYKTQGVLTKVVAVGAEMIDAFAATDQTDHITIQDVRTYCIAATQKMIVGSDDSNSHLSERLIRVLLCRHIPREIGVGQPLHVQCPDRWLHLSIFCKNTAKWRCVPLGANQLILR